jgi:hypothetical protein
MQIVRRVSDYVTTTASKRTQFLVGGRTRALWRQDAGRADARRGRLGGRTRALWRRDAGRVDARRGRSGGRTRADAGTSYLLAVLYLII